MREHVPDRDLVAASMRGDVRAFGTLVERHHAAVTAVAFAVTRDVALAEDIAQDTFIVAWSRLGELRDPSLVRAWLCNIARNQSKNEVRRRVRETAAPDAGIADDRPSAADQVIAREAELQLRTVLDELPETYREPLVLFYWQDKSIQHVASALEISEQAAQKRISRARTMVGDEYAARFDAVARTRRAATVAAAGVVAVLASRATPAAAAAAAAKKAITMTGLVKLMVAITVALGAGAIGWYYVDKRGADASPQAADPRRDAPDNIGGRASASHGRPTLDPDSTASVGTGRPGAQGRFATPAAYEVTVLAPTRVAINLEGGKSSTYLWQDPPRPTFERRVRGRVVDHAGAPIAGAVVVVGDELRVWKGSLQADQGGTTTQMGTFDIALHSEAQAFALALHPKAGWSQLVAVPAGRDHAEVTIRVARPAALRGQVRRASAPTDGHVRVTSGAFEIDLETDAQGRFELALLAPGAYRVAAQSLQLFAGGTSELVQRDVMLEAGRQLDVTLELPAGVLVIVTARDAHALSTIEYVLVPGVVAPKDPAALRELARSGKAQAYLFGGADVDRPMQFHDVVPGRYTLCIDRKLDRDTRLPVTCQELVVTVGKPVIEIDAAASSKSHD